jgi:hypothetical protein
MQNGDRFPRVAPMLRVSRDGGVPRNHGQGASRPYSRKESYYLAGALTLGQTSIGVVKSMDGFPPLAHPPQRLESTPVLVFRQVEGGA